MKYTYPVEEYMNQLKAYNELESMTFSPDDSREYIISRLEERSVKKRVIADIANTIINEYIVRFEKDPEDLTEEDVEKLEEFEDMLYPDGKTIGEIKISDYSIYYRIARILAGYYRRKGDRNNLVLALNRCSIGHMTVINSHSFFGKESPYRDEFLELSKHLDTGELNEKARSKVMASLSRDAISGPDRYPVDMLRYILDTLRSHMTKPLSRYNTLVLFFFCSMILQMFREHIIYAKDHNIPVDKEAAYPLLKEVGDFLKAQVALDPSLDAAGDITVDIHINEFFLGEIPLEDVLDELTERQRSASDNPNPMVQAQGLGMFNNFYLTLLYRFSTLPKEEIVRLCRERVREVLPKLVNVTRMVNNVVFNRYIVEFLYASSPSGTFEEFSDIILESTVYADKALYIHTAMVREMSRVIFDYLVKSSPEIFDGVAGHDHEYISSHRDEMRKLLDDCCMFHDIGKFFMLDVVENSMRKLTEDEIGIIREHPENFLDIFMVNDESDENVLCIRDCALTHHRWHDGTKGYPDIPQTKNRPFADILAVADSIDAATDFLGRPYNAGKTVDSLISEFKERAGTQYCEKVVEALSVPEVRDRLNQLITEGRKDIYYRIYAFNKI